MGALEALRKIRPKKVFVRLKRARPKREALYRALRVPERTWGTATLQTRNLHILPSTYVEISAVRLFSDANRWIQSVIRPLRYLNRQMRVGERSTEKNIVFM